MLSIWQILQTILDKLQSEDIEAATIDGKVDQILSNQAIIITMLQQILTNTEAIQNTLEPPPAIALMISLKRD